MSAEKAIELKPCPFCGGEALGIEQEAHTHVFATFMPDHPGSFTIECPKCNVWLIDANEEIATAAWNRRALRDLPVEAEPVAWKLVPLEATDEMIDAAQACDQEGQDDVMQAWRHLYRVMIDAAPISHPPKSDRLCGIQPAVKAEEG